MSPSGTQIRTAIARLPAQSNSAIAQVLKNARAQTDHDLVQACEAELALRGSLQLSDEMAGRSVAAQMKVKDKGLREVIVIAFQDVPPPYPEEAWALREIAGNPGIRYTELEATYVAEFHKNDLSLVMDISCTTDSDTFDTSSEARSNPIC